MQNDNFKIWLDKLVNIWVQKQPERIVDIVADKFEWYEYPYELVIITKEALIKEWQGIKTQKDISVACDIISTENNTGVAHFSATFVRDTGENVELDGIWVIVLDESGKCTKFHQWYSVKK